MTAQELVLLAVLANQEQQMPLGGLHVEHFRFPFTGNDLEELAFAVRLNIQRGSSAIRPFRELDPRPHAGELVIE